MTPEKIVENHKKYVLQSWSKQGNLNPIPVAKADGIYFYDFDGNRYTDMSSQLVNLNLGYGNKATDYAIIGVKADMADHISSRKLESAFERTIYSYKKHWGGFKVDNMMFYVLNDFFIFMFRWYFDRNIWTLIFTFLGRMELITHIIKYVIFLLCFNLK